MPLLLNFIVDYVIIYRTMSFFCILVEEWCNKFRSDNLTFEDPPFCGRPTFVNDHDLHQALQGNNFISWELGAQSKVHFTSLIAGYLMDWTCNKNIQKQICEKLQQMFCKQPFFYWMVSCAGKWVITTILAEKVDDLSLINKIKVTH